MENMIFLQQIRVKCFKNKYEDEEIMELKKPCLKCTNARECLKNKGNLKAGGEE